jgi:hypothetical protein
MRDLLVGAQVVAGSHPAQPRAEPPLLTSVSGYPLVSVTDPPRHQVAMSCLGLAVMTQTAGAASSASRSTGRGCPPGPGGTDRGGLASGFSCAFLVAAGAMLLVLVSTIVAIRLRRAGLTGTTN